jgi:hypothetical protein
MKQLATELDMAPAELYGYYPSERAIFLGVIDTQLVKFIQSQTAIRHGDHGPVETLRTPASDLVLFDQKSPLAATLRRGPAAIERYRSL